MQRTRRVSHDPKLNPTSALRRHYPPGLCQHYTSDHAAEPAYLADVGAAWRVKLLIDRLTPKLSAPFWFIFLRKRSEYA